MNYEDYAASKMEVLLYKATAAKKAEIADMLAGGSLKTFEDYKYWTGYVAALKDVNDMIVAARKQLNK